jgi:uncharacterized protein YdcH (DUF465 family)
MLPLPGALLSKMAIDADLVRRLHAEDPFFRARADRYAQLDDAIRAHEAAPEPAAKYLAMLKKRREAILLELVDLLARTAPASQEPLWKVPPVQRTLQPKASPARSWRWP